MCENIQLTGFVFKFPLLRMLLRIATHCYGFLRIGGMPGQDWILREGASKSLAHAPIGSQNPLLRSSEGPWELLDPKIENVATDLLWIHMPSIWGNLGPAGGPKENLISGGVKLHINSFAFDPSGGGALCYGCCYGLLRVATDCYGYQ